MALMNVLIREVKVDKNRRMSLAVGKTPKALADESEERPACEVITMTMVEG